MQRRALLAAVAVVAVLAFGVGAATIDDAADAPAVSGDRDRLGDGGPSPPSATDGDQDVGCSSCGFDVIGGGFAIAVALPTIPAAATVPIALVGLATLLVLWRRAGAGEAGVAGVGTDQDRDAVDAGEAGGLAPPPADDPPADNAVYRAWLALRERVGTDRETATAGECERSARERGLDGDAVATLRATFEHVRYGNAPVTEERAERATRAVDEFGEDER